MKKIYKRLASIIASVSILSTLTIGNGTIFSTAKDNNSFVVSADSSYANGYLYYIKSNNKITITGAGASASEIAMIPSEIDGCPVEKIGNDAFYSSTSLKRVVLPNTIKYIGDNAFTFCYNLESINIPSSIIEIGSNAFNSCYKIESVSLPATLQKMGLNVFRDCHNLSLVQFNTPTIKEIPQLAFKNCTALTAFVIPKSVETISESAFEGCSSMQIVQIQDNSNLNRIGASAFKSCNKLTKINIPDSVFYIEENAFNGCSSLSTVNINATNRYIDNTSFKGTPYYTANYTETKCPGYNFGPAKTCTGKQLVYTIFLEDNQTNFTASDKVSKRNILDEATNNITAEAQKYNKNVEFITSKKDSSLEITKTVQNSELTNILDGTSDKFIMELLDDVLAISKYEERLNLLNQYGADGISYVIFINRNGQSYTISGNQEWYNERSLIYDDIRGSAVIMHEMMHLFGAPDLYYSTVLSPTYNEDIMNKCENPCMIGPVTAYAIGWVDGILKTEYNLLYGN